MSAVYRITLVQLKADASALGGPADKIEHGSHPIEEVVRLATNLLKLDAGTKAEPGIIVQRDSKGWRIAPHQGRLRVHKSMSLFDDFWTVDTPAELLSLPPFQVSAAPVNPRPQHAAPARQHSMVRTILEVAGLFAAALVLVAIGLRFGLPQRRLSDLPPGVELVTSSEERANIFAAVAGSYSTGRKAGEQIVIISPDGQVSLGSIGKDGKLTAVRVQEQARAGRQGNIACLVTSFGVIAGIAPPDAVKVGRNEWRKAPTAVN